MKKIYLLLGLIIIVIFLFAAYFLHIEYCWNLQDFANLATTLTLLTTGVAFGALWFQIQGIRQDARSNKMKVFLESHLHIINNLQSSIDRIHERLILNSDILNRYFIISEDSELNTGKWQVRILESRSDATVALGRLERMTGELNYLSVLIGFNVNRILSQNTELEATKNALIRAFENIQSASSPGEPPIYKRVTLTRQEVQIRIQAFESILTFMESMLGYARAEIYGRAYQS
ncbi:hypothetical protein [Leptospira sp. id769339]|uniref:hypothetical protein n=1 Tax=Leptospira sp. id769339 TaxID=2864221 RepID=UPI00214B3964|nr:hypothetical protein [Leptospira sp. id769339]MCR1795868.1 hypothetical protein [Leptospira sp. id769339]